MAGTGSQLSQPPITLLNTANAFTKKYFTPLLPDSIFVPSPLWWMMTRRGQKISGGAIVWGPVTAEESTGDAYWGVQMLDTTPTDPITPAELQWKAYQELIAIPVLDYILNSGDAEVLPLVKIKEETAMASLLQKLSRACQGTAPQNTAIDIDSVPAALGALGGTYAGITLACGTWASNGNLGPNSGGAVSFDNMMADYMSATQGNEMPTDIFTTMNGYRAYWSLLTQQQRQISDDETIRAGFKMHLMFNNARVLFDAFIPAGEMQMFTDKYLIPRFHSRDYFTVDPFIQPTNQRVIVSRIYLILNLQFLTLRQHSRRTGITNA